MTTDYTILILNYHYIYISLDDCVQAETAPCHNQPSCHFNPRRQLDRCQNRMANYLYVSYWCVPVEFDAQANNTYDVCGDVDSAEISDTYGIVQSNGYPTFKAVKKACVRKIHVPPGKTIDVWVEDLAIHEPSTDQRYVMFYFTKSFSLFYSYILYCCCQVHRRLLENH